jgi:hypothetical protein
VPVARSTVVPGAFNVRCREPVNALNEVDFADVRSTDEQDTQHC